MRRFSVSIAKHGDLDGVARLRHGLARVAHVLAKRAELASTCSNPSTPRRDLHEGTERLGAHDLALDDGARSQRRDGVVPRIALERLQRERHLLGPPRIVALLDAQDLHGDGLTDGQHVGRLRAALKADLRRRQQPLDAAHVDERAEVFQRRDDTRQDGARDQLDARLDGARAHVLFEQRAARHDDVRAAAILLEARHAELQPLADVGRRIGDGPQLELRHGAERAHGADQRPRRRPC